MSRMIQVRNVPDKLHRELTRRARVLDLTLTDYIQGLLEREVARPAREEVFARVLSRAPVRSKVSAVELLRAERDERS